LHHAHEARFVLRSTLPIHRLRQTKHATLWRPVYDVDDAGYVLGRERANEPTVIGVVAIVAKDEYMPGRDKKISGVVSYTFVYKVQDPIGFVAQYFDDDFSIYFTEGGLNPL